MSGHYPPGVTGLEPQIAGYAERSEVREVPECRLYGERAGGGDYACGFAGGEAGGELVYDGAWGTFFWQCPEGHDNELEVDVLEEARWDEADAANDRDAEGRW